MLSQCPRVPGDGDDDDDNNNIQNGDFISLIVGALLVNVQPDFYLFVSGLRSTATQQTSVERRSTGVGKRCWICHGELRNIGVIVMFFQSHRF